MKQTRSIESGYESHPLFTPLSIGGVEIKNRIVMPPMTTRAADSEGFVTNDSIAYYCARAEGGVGLITVEMAAPEKAGKHRNFELGIYDDRFVPGLRRLVDALHERGAKVSIQLGHGGGHTRMDINGGERPVAPSAIPHTVEEGTTETIVPEAMDLQRIRACVEAFADAAVRARSAGFDMVEIHGAHGYLISQFLCPAENLRKDEFGGTLENRARLALSIIRRIKEKAPGFPTIFRLSGDDMFPEGMPFQEAQQVAVWAAQAGADAIHVAGGHYRSLPSGAVMAPPMNMADATFLSFASRIRPLVTVPVITVGRLGHPADAIRAIEAGHADFVALGRPLLADPDWPTHVRRGEAVRMCIACNTCINGMRQGFRLHCLVNPMTGREMLLGDAIEREKKLPRGLRIAVIGAGPAGLSYAALVGRRNRVTVFEKSNTVGGSFRIAGLAPKFQEVPADQRVLDRFVSSLEQRCRDSGVVFELNSRIGDLSDLATSFDRVIVATGAKYRWGLGIIPHLLRAGLTKLPMIHNLATQPAIRNWLYYRARRPTRSLVANKNKLRVTAIGDAVQAGKSAAAIRDAFAIAFGVDALRMVKTSDGSQINSID
jgi:2,4-dienoyl-CoA reductase-like NADH-dependent reductase (Old Yellow Enzyme family)